MVERVERFLEQVGD